MTFRELNAMIYMYRRMDEADRRYIVEMLGEEFGKLVRDCTVPKLISPNAAGNNIIYEDPVVSSEEDDAAKEFFQIVQNRNLPARVANTTDTVYKFTDGTTFVIVRADPRDG
jgi:hypothetical protein